MKPVKCRHCGKEEWGHVCGRGVTRNESDVTRNSPEPVTRNTAVTNVTQASASNVTRNDAIALFEHARIVAEKDAEIASLRDGDSTLHVLIAENQRLIAELVQKNLQIAKLQSLLPGLKPNSRAEYMRKFRAKKKDALLPKEVLGPIRVDS